MIRKALFVATSFLFLGSSIGQADAKRAPKSACGIKYLPMSVGDLWTYEFMVPPGVTESAGLKVDPPRMITLNVLDIKTEGKETQVTIVEQYRNVVQTMIFRCDKQGLRVPVKSFLFSGEPGGARGMTLDAPEIKGEFYPSGALKKGSSLFVSLKSGLKPTSKEKDIALSGGRIEMERQLNIGGTSTVETPLGPLKATAVEIEISGRVYLDHTPDKANNMPAVKSKLWFAPGTGLIQVFNRFGHGWRLKSKVNTNAK